MRRPNSSQLRCFFLLGHHATVAFHASVVSHGMAYLEGPWAMVPFGQNKSV